MIKSQQIEAVNVSLDIHTLCLVSQFKKFWQVKHLLEILYILRIGQYFGSLIAYSTMKVDIWL